MDGLDKTPYSMRSETSKGTNRSTESDKDSIADIVDVVNGEFTPSATPSKQGAGLTPLSAVSDKVMQIQGRLQLMQQKTEQWSR